MAEIAQDYHENLQNHQQTIEEENIRKKIKEETMKEIPQNQNSETLTPHYTTYSKKNTYKRHCMHQNPGVQ